MPTADEHRAEATSLGRTLDQLTTLRAELVRHRDDPGTGGGDAHLVTWCLDAALADLDVLGRLVGDLVDELHRRVDLCERYTVEVRRHRVDHGAWLDAVQRHQRTQGTEQPAPWPGPEPLPPMPPFAGAEAG